MLADNKIEISWSCVLDNTPAIWNSFFIWVATLIKCADVAPEAIVVHHVAELRADVGRLIKRLGIRSVPVERFHFRSPHSNKIQQCTTIFETKKIALTDVDIAFLTPAPTEIIKSKIAGKLVDMPNPPIDILANTFNLAKIPIPEHVIASRINDAGEADTFMTFPGNFNGGLYFIDREVLNELGIRWAHWGRCLIDQKWIPLRYAVHVDQIAFCMATVELGIQVENLCNRWNLPSHILTIVDDNPPYIVHYHRNVVGMKLRPLKPSRHEEIIKATNSKITSFLLDHQIN